jgi:cytochrome c-type biogenesis protein CcmH
MRFLHGLYVVSGLALVALLPRTARSQNAADTSVVRGWDDTEAQRLFGRLMSPFCPGLTLASCPSPGADSLRRDIRAKLARGEAPRTIVAAFAADWGEQMLGAPPVRDWGVLLWSLPGIVLLAGGVALALWLRRVRRGGSAVGAAPRAGAEAPPLDPVWRERLDAELEAYEKRL